MKKKTLSKGRGPELTIERILFNGETGEIEAVDLHNETNGRAYFCEVVASHFHGYNKKPLSKGR